MCFEPTREETARSESRRERSTPTHRPSRDFTREDPAQDPEPRGNQERDEVEVERTSEKLAAVLGH